MFPRFLFSFLLITLSLELFPQQGRSIHIFVALCDNTHQAIIKVPESLGNGQNPKINLYWGAAFGIRTYFSKSADWTLVKIYPKPKTYVLERLLFKHKATGVWLLADAYDGQYIKECTIDFLNSAFGNNPETIDFENTNLQFGGNADLVAYIGHDGLMDFSLENNFILRSLPVKKREVIILACDSKYYFSPFIRKSGSYPLLWTSGLMCPEAYTIKAAIDGWLIGEPNETIRERAANAYNQYQKCGLKGARNLLLSGW